MKTCLLPLLLLTFVLAATLLYAQEGLELSNETTTVDKGKHYTTDSDSLILVEIAITYIRSHLEDWGLSTSDVKEMSVNDMYTDESSGITRIWFLQRYQDIAVHNAIINVNINKEGEVFFAGNRFIPHLSQHTNTTTPRISPEQAISKLAAHLNLPFEELSLTRQLSETQFVFDKGTMIREDISVILKYQPYEGEVRLAWDILYSPVVNHDTWSTRIDAVTGEVLHEHNWTIYCPVHDAGSIIPLNVSPNKGLSNPTRHAPESVGSGYNVWPAPIESPNHGPRTLVSDPADPVASPFGWHDINGQPGAEWTITRGNNTYVYQDRGNTGYSSNDEPDGGPELNFNFPYDPSWEPKDYVEASVVNLFYWINYMHDFTYPFGFDEEAGNFQKNNYGRGGQGNDPMFGVAQGAADVGYYGHPFYSHGNDGSSGTVFMEEYYRARRFLTVNAPATVSGIYQTAVASVGWGSGAFISEIPVTAEVIIAEDGVANPHTTDACDVIHNAAQLHGKIALVDRGGCELAYKALQVQNAGAIGLIICNHNDEFFTEILPGTYGAQVNIPVVMISFTNGQILRQHLSSGVIVSLVDPIFGGPPTRDIGLDNGFIAHEYGHGITWRLSGGPNAVCVENDEQMDEGWSDFFALVTSVRPGDTGSKKRGIGTYILDEPTSGIGSRRFPYSTDMTISPLTYADIAITQQRHDVGEVWANMIWDMYWAFVDLYGWSEDPHDPSSGNYKAIRLVFDGIKNLPCHPGFVDGRNAILAADQVLFNGEHQCMLWEVFARRGLGYSADQGSPYDAGDQKEAFDVPPVCANKILISKSVSDLIEAGNDIEVSIIVGNYKHQSAATVIVTDEIPEGTFYKPNSANVPESIQGNSISFSLGDLSFGEEVMITYQLSTASNAWSQRKFLDDAEGATLDHWLVHSTCSNLWSLTDDYSASSGNSCLIATEVPESCVQTLELQHVYAFYVDGNRPVLRFYHRYRTQGAVNGGIVEIKQVGTPNWISVDDKILRNSYPRPISFYTFTLNNRHAFSGDSGKDFLATYIDLSDWAGKTIQIRFRFGTNHVSPQGIGWLIDDIEFMNLLAYNSEACLTTGQGDHECVSAPELGTVVDTRDVTSAVGDIDSDILAIIYPNPAADRISIYAHEDLGQDMHLRLFTTEGRQVYAKQLNIQHATEEVNIAHLLPGFYFAEFTSAKGRTVEKLVIRR